MMLPLLLVLITLVIMEFAVALFHQHIMHGIGWKWHQSHHASHKIVHTKIANQVNSGFVNSGFEKNDLYALFFTIATVLLFIFSTPQSAIWWVGIGISIYGFLYAVMHDVIVHRRLPLRWQPRNAYLRRLTKAHHLHHAVRSQEQGVSFGFLYAPPLESLHTQLRALTKTKILTETPSCPHSDARRQADIPASKVL